MESVATQDWREYFTPDAAAVIEVFMATRCKDSAIDQAGEFAEDLIVADPGSYLADDVFDLCDDKGAVAPFGLEIAREVLTEIDSKMVALAVDDALQASGIDKFIARFERYGDKYEYLEAVETSYYFPGVLS